MKLILMYSSIVVLNAILSLRDNNIYRDMRRLIHISGSLNVNMKVHLS